MLLLRKAKYDKSFLLNFLGGITCFLMYWRVSLWALQLSVRRLRIGVNFSLIFSPWKAKKQVWHPQISQVQQLLFVFRWKLVIFAWVAIYTASSSPSPGVSPWTAPGCGRSPCWHLDTVLSLDPEAPSAAHRDTGEAVPTEGWLYD